MEKQIVKEKLIYIFEEHNAGLSAWADIKANHTSELILITFDHHTDTHTAFASYAFRTLGSSAFDESEFDSLTSQRIARIDWHNKQSVIEAVADLRNDEQIDAALKLGLFNFAFCFNQQDTYTHSIEENNYTWDPFSRVEYNPPKFPFSYDVPDNKIFEIGELCAVGCKTVPHNDNCSPSCDL